MAPNLLGLCGYARVGKNTVGDVLTDFYNYKQLAFADKLRELAYLVDPELGALVGKHGYEMVKSSWPDVREYLVRLGDGARQVLGQDVWLDATLPANKWGLKWQGPPTVVTDVRYRNEAERVRNLGGEVWRIGRSNVGPANRQEHESIGLITYDRFILNDGTINDLVRAVHAEMEK